MQFTKKYINILMYNSESATDFNFSVIYPTHTKIIIKKFLWNIFEPW